MKAIDGPMAPAEKINSNQGPNGEAPRNSIAWELKEYQNPAWDLKAYLLIGLVALVGCVYFAWQRDWFPLGSIVILTTVLFLYKKNQKEETIIFELNKLGVRVNDHFYPYSGIHSFWIGFSGNRKILNIILNKKYIPAIQLDITEIDIYKVKRILAKRVPEQPNKTENIIDFLARLLKI